MDVLLISPPDDFVRYPYLGICQLAAVLREKGVSVGILDSAALKLDLAGIIDSVNGTSPRIVGISVMSMMLRFCGELIHALRESCPECLVVVGGAHLDADPGILRPMKLAYGFRGESEYAFADFCVSYLGTGQAPSGLPGLIQSDGHTVSSSEPVIIEDLDRLPMPAYDLLPAGAYYTPSSRKRAMSYIASRGCPYNCTYCSKLQQKKYRSISAGLVVDHLAYLKRVLGIEWVEFVDEIFTLRTDFILDLCQEMRTRGLRMEWGIGTRIDCLDDELLSEMRGAGLRKIGFGLESGVEAIRFSVNKRIANEKIHEVLRMCVNHKITTMGSFILGLPGETPETMEATIQFANRLPLNYVYFHRLIPIPNSNIFSSLVERGDFPADIWTQFMHGDVPHPVCCPRGVDEETMRVLYQRAWKSTYTNLPRLWRNRRLLLGPGHIIRSVRGLLKLASPNRYAK